MHHALRPIQLFVLAIATMALAAPAALAQTEPLTHSSSPRLIAKQEVHGAPDFNCTLVGPSPPPPLSPIVTVGGCRVHTAAPSVVVTSHLNAGGVEVGVSTCAWEFDMRVDSTGEGYLAHHELTGPLATCTQRACGQTAPPTSEGRAWSMFMEETEVAGLGPRESLVMLFCLENRADGANPSHCEARIPITHPVLHRYRFTAVDVSGHGPAFPHCEISATFDAEAALEVTGEAQAEQRMEIAHD
jgi:hypothetical protein